MSQENWGTFSACVDTVIERSGRLDRLDDVIEFVRQTILETQIEDFFAFDLVEDRLSPPSAGTFVAPTPLDFRQMKAVRYTDKMTPRGEMVYAEQVDPSLPQREKEHYWYLSTDNFVFSGVESIIDIAYYRILPALAYYSREEIAPAQYNLKTQTWTYATRHQTTEQQATARGLVTNWLLFRFFNTIVQGALAKVFNLVQDPRGELAYGGYKRLQTNIIKAHGRSQTSG